MGNNSSEIPGRVSGTYKGIEGFYILNAHGELGYFSADGQRLIKESFSDDTTSTPGGADKIETFNDALRLTSKAFPPGKDKELGYLLPVDNAHVWNTATLVLHERIAKELKDAFDRDIRLGRMTLAEGDRKIRDIVPERGLHRGFEDLLNHIGAFGIHTFFPVLYFRASQGPAQRDDSAYPLRVLNLLSLIDGVGRFSSLLARMRQNLADRGALNRASRVEHRFKLQGEAD